MLQCGAMHEFGSDNNLSIGRSVYLETLGCQMNELDSELVANQLRALGYGFCDNWKDADIVVYNTCSVREHAEAKVYSRIGLVGARKKDKPEIVLAIIGCMAERDGKDMLRRYPQVDILCGPGELDKLPMLIDNAVKTHRHAVALQGNNSRRSGTLAAAEDQLELLDLSRSFDPDFRAGNNRHSAYVRITRGCNKFCTYCVVPFTRGAEIHRPPEHIIEECKKLVDAGVVEITLLGQTVNHYRYEHDHAEVVHGLKQPQKGRSYQGGHERDPFASENVTTFADLLYQVHEQVPDLQRLRFVTSFPRDFGNDVLEVIRDCKRICRYIHIPGQSGSDRILEAMNRGHTVEEYRDFIDRVRQYLPDATIAGDFIVGFSGETDEDFALSLDLLRWARYKNCFVFKYSPRPGTLAYDKLPDDVPEEVKRERNNLMLASQAEISEEIHAAQVGKRLEVLVEGISVKETRRLRLVNNGNSNSNSNSNGGKVQLTIQGLSAVGTDDNNNNNIETAVLGDVVDDNDNDKGPGTPTIQMVGRTAGDLIVMFNVSEDDSEFLPGKIVKVRITHNSMLTLFGELCEAE